MPNEHAKVALWGESGDLGHRYEDYPVHRHLIDLGRDAEDGLMPRGADPWGSQRAMERADAEAPRRESGVRGGAVGSVALEVAGDGDDES
eukprot:scaffold669598_cov83-Prasinocladus_malaysianus.AAC.1